MPSVGTHHLVDFYGVDAGTLADEPRLMESVERALVAAGFHVLRAVSHRFEGGGQGVTGVFLLSESHLAFHTYPEHGYLALDLFSCGSANPDRTLHELVAVFAPAAVESIVRTRGQGIDRDLFSPRRAAG